MRQNPQTIPKTGKKMSGKNILSLKSQIEFFSKLKKLEFFSKLLSVGSFGLSLSLLLNFEGSQSLIWQTKPCKLMSCMID